jgi:adenylate cyclase
MADIKQPPKITLEPAGRPLRVEFRGETLAQSDNALILREGKLPPVLYIPKADIRWDLTEPSDRVTHCPYKGDARYWSVKANGSAAENAIWAYPDAIEAVAPIRACVALYWDKMDAWYLGDKRLERAEF